MLAAQRQPLGLIIHQELHLGIQGAWGRPRSTAASSTMFNSSISKHPPTPRCFVLIRWHRLPSSLLERWQFSLCCCSSSLSYCTFPRVVSSAFLLTSCLLRNLKSCDPAPPLLFAAGSGAAQTDRRLHGTGYLRAVLPMQVRPQWRNLAADLPSKMAHNSLGKRSFALHA